MDGNFSIITPNYNMAGYLAETIESVLANLRPGDEYFIIDGGSTDGSVDIIRRYEHRLTGWVSEKDRGYADALAKGFAGSSGEFQCWVNCGDLLVPDALRKARELLSSEEIDFFYGNAADIDDDGKILWISQADFQPLRRYMQLGGWTPLQISCFWRKQLYQRCGGIDPEVKLAADYDLFLRMTRTARTQYWPLVFGAHRHHQGQLSISQIGKYNEERYNIRSKELTMDNSAAGWLIMAYYWLLTRLKCRYFNRSPLTRLWVNQDFSAIKNAV